MCFAFFCALVHSWLVVSFGTVTFCLVFDFSCNTFFSPNISLIFIFSHVRSFVFLLPSFNLFLFSLDFVWRPFQTSRIECNHTLKNLDAKRNTIVETLTGRTVYHHMVQNVISTHFVLFQLLLFLLLLLQSFHLTLCFLHLIHHVSIPFCVSSSSIRLFILNLVRIHIRMCAVRTKKLISLLQ